MKAPPGKDGGGVCVLLMYKCFSPLRAVYQKAVKERDTKSTDECLRDRCVKWPWYITLSFKAGAMKISVVLSWHTKCACVWMYVFVVYKLYLIATFPRISRCFTGLIALEYKCLYRSCAYNLLLFFLICYPFVCMYYMKMCIHEFNLLQFKYVLEIYNVNALTTAPWANTLLFSITKVFVLIIFPK